MPVTFAASTIIAQAFSMVELSAPSSFGDDSDQARDATLHYDSAIDMCLEWTDWSFASRMVTLPAASLPSGTAADPRLPYVYALPGDCVMLRELTDTAVRYRLDEGYLRADAPAPLGIRYTRRVQDESRLPATFRAAVALQLAVLMAPRWLGVETKRASLANALDELRRRCSKSDARTASPAPYGEAQITASVSEALR